MRKRVKREDCRTCMALAQAGVGVKYDGQLAMDCSDDAPSDAKMFPPEVAKLVVVADCDRPPTTPIEQDARDVRRGVLGVDCGDRHLRRCRECGTLYRYSHSYSNNCPGRTDVHSIWRLEDAVGTVVAPLLEPLSPQAFDAALADALRSQLPDARDAAALVMEGVAGKSVASPWEPWAEGSWAEFNISNASQGMGSETIQKQTVSTRGPREITLRIEVRMTKPAVAKISVTEMKIPMTAAGSGSGRGSAPKKLSQGAETIEISGRKLDCEWVEYEIEAAGSKGTSKVWSCPDVPGSTVKTVTKGWSMESTMVLTGFEGKKTP